MPPSSPLSPPSLAELAHLAIFPLPDVVFFPDTLLPLHVFEPRYRQLVSDALADQLPIAVPLLREGSPPDPRGRPAFHRVAGVGRIVDHQPLPDGRSNIVLSGVGRAFVVRELDSDRLYRVVQAEPIEVPPVAVGWTEEALGRLHQCILALNRARPRLGGPLVQTLTRARSAEPLVNALASVIFPEAERRQEILAEPSLDGRYAFVLGQLVDLLAQLGASEPAN